MWVLKQAEFKKHTPWIIVFIASGIVKKDKIQIYRYIYHY